MEETGSSRKVGSVPVYPTKRRYIPEEPCLHIHRFDNLKYYSIKENLKELRFKKLNRINLVQERVYWWTLVKTGVSCPVS
jgi:hypothetical protein